MTPQQLKHPVGSLCLWEHGYHSKQTLQLSCQILCYSEYWPQQRSV